MTLTTMKQTRSIPQRALELEGPFSVVQNSSGVWAFLSLHKPVSDLGQLPAGGSVDKAVPCCGRQSAGRGASVRHQQSTAPATGGYIIFRVHCELKIWGPLIQTSGKGFLLSSMINLSTIHGVFLICFLKSYSFRLRYMSSGESHRHPGPQPTTRPEEACASLQRSLKPSSGPQRGHRVTTVAEQSQVGSRQPGTHG